MGTITRHAPGSTTLNVLIHGQTSSKEEWTSAGGYTKGGDLTRLLDEHGQSWIAGDLYGHGEWAADEPDFDSADISDGEWTEFLGRSAAGVRRALDLALEQQAYSVLNFVTYSMGCLVAVEIMKQGLPIPVGRIVMAVPTPEREYDDDSSLHNNLAVFSSAFTAVAMGRFDEDVNPQDIVWFFDQIPGDRKLLRSYDSGHSLPEAWVSDVIHDLIL